MTCAAPANRTEDMNQAATYWPPGANDGLGGRRVGTPVPIVCRWQHDAKLFRTRDGREAVSAGVVYTSIPVEIGGFLLLGTHTDDVPPREAEEVQQVGQSPSLEFDEVLNKAWV